MVAKPAGTPRRASGESVATRPPAGGADRSGVVGLRTAPAPSTGPAPGTRRAETGAVMVEFAFALMFIFLIFIAYVKISEIFLAQSRLRYACFAASRTQAVHGSAQDAASKIDKDYTLTATSKKVRMEKTIELPKAVGTLFGTGESFKISHEVKIFSEPSQSGDNKAK